METIDAVNIQFPPYDRINFLEKISERKIRKGNNYLIIDKNKIAFSGKMDSRYVNIKIILKDENYLETIQHALRYKRIDAETIKKRSNDISINTIDDSVLNNISNAIVDEIIENSKYSVADYFIEPVLLQLSPYEKEIRNFYEKLKGYGFSEFSIKKTEGKYQVIDTYLDKIFEIKNKTIGELEDIVGDGYLSGSDLIEFSNLSKSVENNENYSYIAGQDLGDAIRKSIEVHRLYFELFGEKQ